MEEDLRTLDDYWRSLQRVHQLAISDGGRRAIEKVMKAFSEDIDAAIRERQDGKADREETAIRRKEWD